MDCENCMHECVCMYDGTKTSVNYCSFYEAPRPHGKWVPGREIGQMWTGDKFVAIDYEDFSCSCCGVVVEESTEPEWNFCPNCGADMRTQNDRSRDTSARGVSGSVKNSIAQEEGEAE